MGGDEWGGGGGGGGLWGVVGGERKGGGGGWCFTLPKNNLYPRVPLAERYVRLRNNVKLLLSCVSVDHFVKVKRERSWGRGVRINIRQQCYYYHHNCDSRATSMPFFVLIFSFFFIYIQERKQVHQ